MFTSLLFDCRTERSLICVLVIEVFFVNMKSVKNRKVWASFWYKRCCDRLVNVKYFIMIGLNSSFVLIIRLTNMIVFSMIGHMDMDVCRYIVAIGGLMKNCSADGLDASSSCTYLPLCTQYKQNRVKSERNFCFALNSRVLSLAYWYCIRWGPYKYNFKMGIMERSLTAIKLNGDMIL